MQVLIVEDELLMATRLQKVLSHAEPGAMVTAITQSVEETVNWLQNNEAPDLILMDIELADGQSFDIFNRTEVTAPVIFATAYDEYAIKAFKVNSVDYLLKPIKEEELKKALQKFKQTAQAPVIQKNIQTLLQEIKKIQPPVEQRNRFLVKAGQKLKSIEVKDVAYFFSEHGVTFLFTGLNQKYIVDYTLDELENSLSPQQFFRANRQYLLSAASITAIHSWFNQKLKLEVTPATAEHVVISREKANTFKRWMGE